MPEKLLFTSEEKEASWNLPTDTQRTGIEHSDLGALEVDAPNNKIKVKQ